MIYLGNTIEEALEVASKEINKDKEELIYEIIEDKNSLGKKQIGIEIKGFKERGKIGILNGEIVFTPKELPPSIIVGEGVKVKINNILVIEKSYVNENDKIDIELEHKEAKRIVDIEVSEDKMQAFIKIRYEPKIVYKLKDKEPQSEILIEAEKYIEEYPPKFTKEEIEEILKTNKIKYGIQWQVINAVVEGGEALIAKGLEPTEAIDDKIDYFFAIENKKVLVEKDGKVDFYNTGEIQCVEPGQVLAVRHVGKDGKVGYDVHGNVIIPKKRKIVKIVKGQGCDVLDEGSRAVALIKGVPKLQNEQITVSPVHMINGDVDIKTGNVEFKGNIVVKGNVTSGMKVKAGTDITIMQDVEDALVLAGGNIKIGGNIIKSVIKAGERQLNYDSAINYIKYFKDFLKRIIVLHDEIKKKGKINSDNQIVHAIKILLDSQLKDDKNKILEADEFIKENCDGELLSFWDRCINIFKLIETESISNFLIFNQFVGFAENFISSYQNEHDLADVTIYYCQNSEIYATNNVEVKGKGCYNTNINALNEVIFSSSSGVFRGGQIFAKKRIKAGEVGSHAGIKTILKTSTNSIIEASVVYQNTILTFGDSYYRIEYPCKNLKAYVQKGEIIVEKLKL
ncbi:MAG: FapA family protein [Caloramator sp.]|nr:FapA family protein [Caloramator sp.]